MKIKIQKEKLNALPVLQGFKNKVPLVSFMEGITTKVQRVLSLDQDEKIQEMEGIDQELFFSICREYGYKAFCDESVYLASKHLFKNQEDLRMFLSLLYEKCGTYSNIFSYKELSFMFFLCKTYEDFFYFFKKKYLMHIFYSLQYKQLFAFESFSDVHALMDFLESPNGVIIFNFFSLIGDNEEVFEYIRRFYKTTEEICELCRRCSERNEARPTVLKEFGKKESFFSRLLRDFIRNKEDFEYVMGSTSVFNFFYYFHVDQLNLLLEMYRVRSFEEMKQIFEQGYRKVIVFLSWYDNHKKNIEYNTELVTMLRNLNGEDFEYFISQISSGNEFLNKVYENNKEYAGKHLEIVLSLYGVKDIRQFFSVLSKESVQKFLLYNERIDISPGMKEFFATFQDSEKMLLCNFLEKEVFPAKHNYQYFFGISIPKEEMERYKIMFLHFLTYRKKSFLDFLKKVYVFSGMGIKMNIQQFRTLDDYKENNEIDGKRLMGDVARILEFLQKNNKEKILQNLENALRTKHEESILRICMDVVLEYVEVYLERKLYTHIVSDFKIEARKIGMSWEDIDKEELWEKVRRKEFLEAYKIVRAPRYNREQGRELLLKYLRGDFERVEECRQYDTEKNRRWMEKFLGEHERKLWLSRMRREYEVEVFGTKKRLVIEKELDPLKIMMMGDRVDGSCLSYYSNKGNYYSVISNAVDVNKGVFYIYDEEGKLLGRFLVTIGNDKRISRYSIYYRKRLEGVDFDAIVKTYVKEIAENLHMKLNGNKDQVVPIESEHSYFDLPIKVE